MHFVMWRFFPYDEHLFAYTEVEEFHLANNEILEIQTENGRLRSTTDVNSLHPGARHVLLPEKLVEDFLSVLRLGRLRDELGYCYSWQPGEHPKSTAGKRTVECCIENMVLFVAVTMQTTTPLDTLSRDHSPALGNDVPDKEV